MTPVSTTTRSRRRRRALANPLALGSALLFTLLAAGATVAWGTLPQVEARNPELGTRDSQARIVVVLDRAERLTADGLRVELDGRDVSSRATVHDGRIVVQPGRLDEGVHRVRIRTQKLGLLRRRIDERWSFVVDSTKPAVRVSSPSSERRGPARSDERQTRFTLQTEPRATVSFGVAGRTSTTRADERGRASRRVRLGEGRNRVRVTVTDSVGNVTRKTVQVKVDSLRPVVGLVLAKRRASREFPIVVSASDASGVELHATLNGSDEDIDVRRSGRSRFSITGESALAEGMHRVSVTAVDGFGHRTKVERVVLVDSSERLGENALRRGARGADVRQLQQQLRRLGFFKAAAGTPAEREWRAQRFGSDTGFAVRKFQQSKGLAEDGVAGTDTIAALTLKIVIDRAAHSLTLYRLGEVVRTYPVAVGSAKYPTPAGDFAIEEMQKNPTWTPPDSDWAKDAEPIPPGPDNPLGTRWMRIYGTVGVHGTNNPASLGYSVSHGCIRMSIPDVEELFEIVAVGTPVTVV